MLATYRPPPPHPAPRSSHFSANEPFVPLGKSVWRWRLLASRGWKVVTVREAAGWVHGWAGSTAAAFSHCCRAYLERAAVVGSSALRLLSHPLCPFRAARQLARPFSLLCCRNARLQQCIVTGQGPKLPVPPPHPLCPAAPLPRAQVPYYRWAVLRTTDERKEFLWRLLQVGWAGAACAGGAAGGLCSWAGCAGGQGGKGAARHGLLSTQRESVSMMWCPPPCVFPRSASRCGSA